MTKHCRSEYWMTAGCFDFVIPCERPSRHKGPHRGTKPPRCGGGRWEWRKVDAGPPKGMLGPLGPRKHTGKFRRDILGET
jgi:hypothetical protein